ncbi:MAG TPA: 2-phosphosulfolactate phosphatase [Candidatus Dormibacteraeota bacterium]|jgi:2-phosphosulfolactate phosphatase|nr:2-phosphosulfolactate phosphatase [Candidatus Dormibacteraeota bacterium]
MLIVHARGLEGARAAVGTVVVIDVLRAFTVSAYALAAGAIECRLVAEMAEARDLASRLEGAVLSAEEAGLPVEGVPISNSPSMIRGLELRGRTLVQRSSAGTRCVAAASRAERLFAASLVVADATACAVLADRPEVVTLVATGEDRGHSEDRACAEYLEGRLRGGRPDLSRLLGPLRSSDRYRRLAAGAWPGFPPEDLELALAADRFDFAMPVERDHLGLRLTARRCRAT